MNDIKLTNEELSKIADRIGLLNITPLHEVIANVRKDVPALVAEVKQLRAERDAIIGLLVSDRNDECPSDFAECPNTAIDGHGSSKTDCWLKFARNEVSKGEA